MGIVALGIVAAAAESRLHARGWTHDTFGRLVIDGAEKLVQGIALDGDSLVIEFKEPVAIEFGAALGNLETYVAVEPVTSPRRVTLALKRAVTIKTFINKGNQVIDLRPAAEKRPMPESPAEPAPEIANAAAPEIANAAAPDKAAAEPMAAPEPQSAVASNSDEAALVLASSQPPEIAISRRQTADGAAIVFDWPVPVDYQVRRAGQYTIIDFKSAGRIDASRLTTAFPEGEVRLETPPSGGIRVILRLAPGMELRDSRDGNAVILALTRPSGEAAPPPDAVREFHTAAQGNVPSVQPRAYVTLMAMPAPDDLLSGVAALEDGPGGEPVAVEIRTRAVAGGIELRFDFQAQVRAAAFHVADGWWLVFDHAPLQAPKLPSGKLPAEIGEIEIVPLKDGLALRISTPHRFGIEMKGEGNTWSAVLRAGGTAEPAEPIATRRETLAEGGSSLLLVAPAPGAPIEINGAFGRMLVVTLPTQGQGIARPIEESGYLVLPSHQGIVISPSSNRLQIAALPRGVVLTMQGRSTPAPLLSDPAPEEGVARLLPVVAGMFDLARWRRGGEANFASDRRSLEDLVISAPERERPARRLELAEFLFAHGLTDEALGQLNLIGMTDPSRSGEIVPTLLRAAVLYFKGDYAEAEKLLASPALDLTPEAHLFRAALAAERQDWASASDLFSGPLPSIADYPRSFRARLGLSAATALAEGGDPLAARSFLDQLSGADLAGDVTDRAAFIGGLVQARIGKNAEAIKIWAGLQGSQVGEVRARATLAVTEDRLAKGEIDAAQAADALDGIRFAWRGNDFEFRMLRRLGELYLESAQAKKGLATLRYAATYFPNRPEAKDVAARMQAAFRELYLEDDANNLSPMTAVALYDEFRELTPSGADGDRMIAALADRLVKVDLLDLAGRILADQVAKRLAGLEKAKVGTRLAAIRLLDRKPDLALGALSDSALDESLPEEMPRELLAERTRLEASARFEVGDTLAGINLLSRDKSIDALWLRADMYWRLREWASAAEALDDLIRAELAAREPEAAKAEAQSDLAADPMLAIEDGPSGPELAKAETMRRYFKEWVAPLLLNRAVALSLAGNRRALKGLAKEFGTAMVESDQARGFAMLTAPDGGLVESVSAEMRSVDQIQTFVDDYRQRLEKTSLGGS